MRHSAVALIALTFAALATACDDPNAGLLDPALVTDTVQLAAPSPEHASIANALDLTTLTLRFPELASDAAAWDLAVRVRDGQLALVPAGTLGLRDPIAGSLSRAGVTNPIPGQTLEGLREAPKSEEFVTDAATVLRVGSLYAARSRGVSCGFSSGYNYAKFTVLSADPATGLVSLAITANRNCGDVRLVPVD